VYRSIHRKEQRDYYRVKEKKMSSPGTKWGISEERRRDSACFWLEEAILKKCILPRTAKLIDKELVSDKKGRKRRKTLEGSYQYISQGVDGSWAGERAVCLALTNSTENSPSSEVIGGESKHPEGRLKTQLRSLVNYLGEQEGPPENSEKKRWTDPSIREEPLLR